MISHIALRLTLRNSQWHYLATLAYHVSNLRNSELILEWRFYLEQLCFPRVPFSHTQITNKVLHSTLALTEAFHISQVRDSRKDSLLLPQVRNWDSRRCDGIVPTSLSTWWLSRHSHQCPDTSPALSRPPLSQNCGPPHPARGLPSHGLRENYMEVFIGEYLINRYWIIRKCKWMQEGLSNVLFRDEECVLHKTGILTCHADIVNCLLLKSKWCSFP